jgi:hypothetical protein
MNKEVLSTLASAMMAMDTAARCIDSIDVRGDAVANPTYVSILMEVTVNRSATEVWKRVGKYCDIGEWMQVACTINAGKEGEIGAVRSVGNEVLVGKTGFCCN